MIELGHRASIDQLSSLIGSGQALVLNMKLSHAKNWRKKVQFQRNMIVQHYRDLILASESSHEANAEETILILHDYTFMVYLLAGDPGKYKPEEPTDKPWEPPSSDRPEHLAARLREQTKAKCKEFMGTNSGISTRGLILSTDILSLIYEQSNFKLSCDILDDAVEILRYGDPVCQTWAATFSKRLKVWFNTRKYSERSKKESNRMVAIRKSMPKLLPRIEKCEKGGTKRVDLLRKRRLDAKKAFSDTLNSTLTGNIEAKTAADIFNLEQE
ncbi:hypothetical protein G7Z17_g3 [Cylindrodendrum hubeiense]|uniref:Uncharacterized protein n=1 Tax=Cylindrodendrum hubeiense TaxID=595255 RepID=A0A9P5HHF1_9HYPO|nr:hypothetical protein G7Z17_g3 [Cylindrodendrum hubeiense]